MLRKLAKDYVWRQIYVTEKEVQSPTFVMTML